VTNRRRTITFTTWSLILPVALLVSGTPFWNARAFDIVLIAMVSVYFGLVGLGDG
jgi:hypothetical protein